MIIQCSQADRGFEFGSHVRRLQRKTDQVQYEADYEAPPFTDFADVKKCHSVANNKNQEKMDVKRYEMPRNVNSRISILYRQAVEKNGREEWTITH